MEQFRIEDLALPDYFPGVLSDIFKAPAKNIALVSLKGDASDRNYYRLKFTNSENAASSVVVMQLANPPIPKGIPFVTTQAYLMEFRIDVPELYYIDEEKGLIFLEDLGDVTLEEKLKTSTHEEQEKYYRQAIDILLNMQVEGTRRLRNEIPARNLAFDLKKLTWELDFMTTHFIEGFLNKSISLQDRRILQEGFSRICSLLENQKRYFCHRDYHSRNIMLSGNKLYLLDFQDARMGPCQYDLASLLRDSYFKLNSELSGSLLNYYINKKEEIEDEAVNRDEFLKIFDWMCIQRNLKALGTFGYQVNSRKNNRYREAIPRTVEYVFENLGKYNELEKLEKCIEVLYN